MRYIALDSETSRGRMFLLSWPNGVARIHTIDDFFNVISRLGNRFVWYNLDYDVTGLVGLVGEKRLLQEFFIRGYAEHGGYVLEYVSGKKFVFRKDGYFSEHYDIYHFFQTSLKEAVRRFLPGKAGKKRISKKILTQLDDRVYSRYRRMIDEYARQDAVILQGLADELMQSLSIIGDVKPVSPGYVAKYYLKKRGISFGRVPREYESFVRRAYYGGCVEIYQRGCFEDVWAYDLKSAYPWAFSQMPDFSKAEYWLSSKREANFCVAEIIVTSPDCHVQLLPVRSRGLNIFPQTVKSRLWVTNYELDCLDEMGADYEIVEVLNISADDSRPYMSFISELYAKRNDGMNGLVYKLIMNSLYGISAESNRSYDRLTEDESLAWMNREWMRIQKEIFLVEMEQHCPYARDYWVGECNCDVCRDVRRIMAGLVRYPADRRVIELGEMLYKAREKGGRYRNVCLAAFVTALVRCKMWRYKRMIPPEKLLACFTDGIKVIGPVFGAGEEKNLGAMVVEKGGGRMLLIGSGIYQHGDLVRIRGYHYNGSLWELMKKHSKRTLVPIKIHARISGREAVRLVRYEDLNLISFENRILDINFDRKRRWPHAIPNAGWMLEHFQISEPLIVGDAL